MRSCWWKVAVVVVALARCGDTGGASRPADAGPEEPLIPAPTILTTGLTDAVLGTDYHQVLSVKDGTRPLVWSLRNVAPELS